MDAAMQRNPRQAIERASNCEPKLRQSVKATRPLFVPSTTGTGTIIVVRDSEDEDVLPNCNHNVNAKAPSAQEHIRYFSPNDIFRDDVEDTQVADEVSQSTSAHGVPPRAKVTCRSVIQETQSYIRASRSDITTPTFSPNELLQFPSTDDVHDTDTGIAGLPSTVEQTDSSNSSEFLQDSIVDTGHLMDDSQVQQNPRSDFHNNGLDAGVIDLPHCRSKCNLGLETGLSSEAVPDQDNARTAVGAARASFGPALVRFISHASDNDALGEKAPEASLAPSASYLSPPSVNEYIPFQDNSVCQAARASSGSKDFLSDWSDSASGSSKQLQLINVLVDGDKVLCTSTGTGERRRLCSVCSKLLCLINAYCKVACKHVSLPCCSTGTGPF